MLDSESQATAKLIGATVYPRAVRGSPTPHLVPTEGLSHCHAFGHFARPAVGGCGEVGDLRRARVKLRSIMLDSESQATAKRIGAAVYPTVWLIRAASFRKVSLASFSINLA